jgi:hypothetical protein
LVETAWLWPPFSANNRPEMTSDGRDGVLIAWADEGRTLRAQRVRSDGTKLWGDDGVTFRNSSSVGSIPSICSDGRGGALAFWAEWDTSATSLAVRGQHLSDSGEALWEPSGREVSTQAYAFLEESFPPSVSLNFSPHSPAILAVPDGRGGAVLAWSSATDSVLQVFATRVSRDGGLPWNGELHVCPADAHQRQLSCSTSAGRDVVLAWQDHRNPSAPEIFAQAISFAGRRRWSEEGVPVATGPGERSSPAVHDDGRGSVFIAWGEAANGGTLRVQRLLASGRPAPSWPENGKQVSATAHPNADVPLAPQLISSECGSIIVAWNDVREVPQLRSRLLGMRVNHDGPEANGGPIAAKKSPVVSEPVSRNDDDHFFIRSASLTATSVAGTVEFGVPSGERAILEVVDVQGRRLCSQEVRTASPGIQRLRVADLINLRSGVYFVRLEQGRRFATARVAVIQ